MRSETRSTMVRRVFPVVAFLSIFLSAGYTTVARPALAADPVFRAEFTNCFSGVLEQFWSGFNCARSPLPPDSTGPGSDCRQWFLSAQQAGAGVQLLRRGTTWVENSATRRTQSDPNAPGNPLTSVWMSTLSSDGLLTTTATHRVYSETNPSFWVMEETGIEIIDLETGTESLQIEYVYRELPRPPTPGDPAGCPLGSEVHRVLRVQDSVLISLTPVVNPPPVISKLSPSSGVAGDQVTITGAFFHDSQGVATFGTTAASVTSWGDTQIVVTVPALAKGDYEVFVTPPAGQRSNSVRFSVVECVAANALGERPLFDVEALDSQSSEKVERFPGTLAEYEAYVGAIGVLCPGGVQRPGWSGCTRPVVGTSWHVTDIVQSQGKKKMCASGLRTIELATARSDVSLLLWQPVNCPITKACNDEILRFEKDLRVHEQGHVDINNEIFAKEGKKLGGSKPVTECITSEEVLPPEEALKLKIANEANTVREKILKRTDPFQGDHLKLDQVDMDPIAPGPQPIAPISRALCSDQ
jgi:hypothetical protein